MYYVLNDDITAASRHWHHLDILTHTEMCELIAEVGTANADMFASYDDAYAFKLLSL